MSAKEYRWVWIYFRNLTSVDKWNKIKLYQSHISFPSEADCIVDALLHNENAPMGYEDSFLYVSENNNGHVDMYGVDLSYQDNPDIK